MRGDGGVGVGAVSKEIERPLLDLPVRRARDDVVE